MHVCDFTTAQISNKYVHKQHSHHSENEIEFNQFENRDVPCGGTMLKALVALVPLHNRCRKMYAVQFLKRPPGSRRSEEQEEDVGSHQKEASSREDAPQKFDRPHT